MEAEQTRHKNTSHVGYACKKCTQYAQHVIVQFTVNAHT